MLFGGGKLDHPGTTYRFAFALERTFRLFFVERGRMRFDTRFMPPRESAGPGLAVLYAFWSGETELCEHGVRLGSPGAVLADEAFFEGSASGPPAHVAATGASWSGLELRVQASSLTESMRDRCMLRGFVVPELAQATYTAAATAFDALDQRVRAERAVSELLAGLARDGVLASEVAASIVAAESERVLRVWDAVQAAFARLDAGVPLQQLAEERGVSLRQLAREFEEFTRAFTVGVDPFREQRGELRLRLASVLLSLPELTIAEVARIGGWGSTAALDRAFRDAKMPPPSRIRAASIPPDR